MKKLLSFAVVLVATGAFSIPATLQQHSIAIPLALNKVSRSIVPTCFASILQAAHEHSITGIVAARLVQPDGQTTAFVLAEQAEPAVTVNASGADADKLVPRNQVKMVGSPVMGAFGTAYQIKIGSVTVGETNQPFRSMPIAPEGFKDASANAGKYAQLAGMTFVANKFDNSGTASLRAEDGSTVSLLISKGAAGHEKPKGVTDVFGIVVRTGGEWKLAAARFLPANRKSMLELAAKTTCIACHNPDIQGVGPAYRDVAARYRNDRAAAGKLIAQMQNGGTGKWGAAVMPALNLTVQPDDMQKLADWILSYRWDSLLAE